MVVEVHFQFDFRVCLAKSRHQRQQKTVADGREADPQATTRGLYRMGQHGLRILEVVEDAPAALIEQLAFRRQADLARTALEQPHLQRTLQAGNVLADRRCGNTHRPRRADKAQRLGGFHEGEDAVQAFHGITSLLSIMSGVPACLSSIAATIDLTHTELQQEG